MTHIWWSPLGMPGSVSVPSSGVLLGLTRERGTLQKGSLIAYMGVLDWVLASRANGERGLSLCLSNKLIFERNMLNNLDNIQEQNLHLDFCLFEKSRKTCNRNYDFKLPNEGLNKEHISKRREFHLDIKMVRVYIITYIVPITLFHLQDLQLLNVRSGASSEAAK